MTVASFLAPRRIDHQLACFNRLRASLERIDNVTLELNRDDADFYIAWGWSAARCAPGDVIVVECGYLGDRLQNWSFAWNGLNNAGLGPYRGANRRRAADYGVTPGRWRHADNRVALMLGQVEGDAALEDCPDYGAFLDLGAQLLRDAGYTPVFRRHPKAGVQTIPGVENWSSLAPLLEQARRARVCFTWNSNAAVEVVLDGTPCIVWDDASIASDVCALREIAEVRRARNDWLMLLESRTFTPGEIDGGEWYQPLMACRPI